MHIHTASFVAFVLIISTTMGTTSSPTTAETEPPVVKDTPVAEKAVVGIHVPDMSWNWLIITVAFVVVGGCCCFVCVSHSGQSIMGMFDPDGNCATLLACACPTCPCGEDKDNICVCTIS